jgi:hypothetical protein
VRTARSAPRSSRSAAIASAAALQLSTGAKRKGMNTRVAHVVELLDEAY